MSVYTQSNLVKVFAELKFQTGKYNSATWHGTMPQFPDDMDEADKELVYQAVLNNTDKYFLNRKPKSWQSLAMQVAICLSIHKIEQATIETRGRNRVAAYMSGFLTMKDIIHLEDEEHILVTSKDQKENDCV